jgi:hypothetical protein
MIQNVALILTAAQIVLTVMFLIGTIYSRLAWPVKSFLIVAGFICGASSYWVFKTSLGWPVADIPKEDMQFVAAVVDEPTPTSKGAIYVWYRSQGSVVPRSISIPYSKNAHEKLQDAQERDKKGQRSFVRLTTKDTPDGEPQDGQQRTDTEVQMDFVPPPPFKFEK